MSGTRGVAFVGAGFISYMHNYALRVYGGAQLMAIASNSRRMAEHRAHIFAAEPYVFSDLDRMLARPDVETVFILSPNALHARHALAALRAGKHVVVEKPMALTLAEARAIVELAEKTRLQVGYAENQVFSPVVRRARELVAGGAVGKVQRVVAFVGHGGPAPDGWFWNPALAGGGAQFDLGSHTVEAALYLAGQPQIRRVERAVLTAHPSGVDSRAEAVLVSADGIEFQLTTSYVEPEESMWYEVHGDRGVVRCVYSPAPLAQQITLSAPGEQPQDIDFPHRYEMLRVDRYIGSMGYVDQAVHFLDCFQSGRTPSESAADGARVLAILAAIYLAAGRRRPVDVAEVPADVAPVDLWKRGG
jgi:myo-inositol 2-dehydrogenase/D-chiro-inositol 1-dehydrogenase